MAVLPVGLARAVALLSIGLLAVGCTATIDGSARPAPNLKPRSITGRTIERVLLGDGELSQILHQSFDVDARFPKRFGGAETLQDDGSASPVDCLGVALMLQQNVYQSTHLTHVAAEAWRRTVKTQKVTSVKEGVVSLPTAADANALFATFVRQWHKCDGATLPLPGGMFKLKGKITDVGVATSVLAATVSVDWARSSLDSASIPEGRAIGVRGNCLVEVEVDFFSASGPSHEESGTLNSRAVDIARAMMDKVGALI
jgi:PknH-like extracellular domain